MSLDHDFHCVTAQYVQILQTVKGSVLFWVRYQAIHSLQRPKNRGKLHLNVLAVALQPARMGNALKSTVILQIFHKTVNSLIFDMMHVIFNPCTR